MLKYNIYHINVIIMQDTILKAKIKVKMQIKRVNC